MLIAPFTLVDYVTLWQRDLLDKYPYRACLLAVEGCQNVQKVQKAAPSPFFLSLSLRLGMLAIKKDIQCPLCYVVIDNMVGVCEANHAVCNDCFVSHVRIAGREDAYGRRRALCPMGCNTICWSDPNPIPALNNVAAKFLASTEDTSPRESPRLRARQSPPQRRPAAPRDRGANVVLRVPPAQVAAAQEAVLRVVRAAARQDAAEAERERQAALGTLRMVFAWLLTTVADFLTWARRLLLLTWVVLTCMRAQRWMGGGLLYFLGFLPSRTIYFSDDGFALGALDLALWSTIAAQFECVWGSAKMVLGVCKRLRNSPHWTPLLWLVPGLLICGAITSQHLFLLAETALEIAAR